MVHIKKISLLILIGTIVFYIGNSLTKGTHSLDKYIEFNQTVEVDKTKKYINRLNVDTTISSLINSLNKKNDKVIIKIYDSSNKIKNSNDLLASGDFLRILENNELKENYQISIVGDSNGDGILDLIDLVQMRKHIVGWLNPETNQVQRKTGIFFYSLDLNNDKIIDLIDLVQMRKAIVNRNLGENQETYTITFNTDGGSSISSQKVKAGNKVTKPNNPTKTGYEFVTWLLNGQEYNFNSSVTINIELTAKWKKNEVYEPAEIKYSLSSKNGKWIFINNPEMLLENHLTDNSGKAVYSDFINGNAEIYFEHNLQADDVNKSKNIEGKANYVIRFHNPYTTQATLKINACGSTIARGSGQKYIDTWEEYYKFKKCSIEGITYTIAPYSSQYLYLNTYQTGSGWSDFDSDFITQPPTTKIPASVIDGVLNVTSSGKLHVESFIFTNPATIPQKTFDHSDNYIDTDRNKAVYSGYYPALPNVNANIRFEIYDNTQTGTLKVKYDTGNTSTRDVWYTHNIGNYEPKDNCYIKDSLQPIMSNNTAYNWGNWAVHYTENITLVNSGSKDRQIAYYVQAYYGGTGTASSLVAFPVNQSLSYIYKREGIGKWQDTNEFLKVWEIKVPANSSVTVPTEILLGGNCSGTIGHKVELVR